MLFAGHMAREEADVLPLLQARLCTKQQRDMVWRTLQAMPLRLLERVLPWLAGLHPTPALKAALGTVTLMAADGVPPGLAPLWPLPAEAIQVPRGCSCFDAG